MRTRWRSTIRFGARGPTPASATPAGTRGTVVRDRRLLALTTLYVICGRRRHRRRCSNDGFDGTLVQACNEDFVVAASDGGSEIVVVRRIFGNDLVRTLSPRGSPVGATDSLRGLHRCVRSSRQGARRADYEYRRPSSTCSVSTGLLAIPSRAAYLLAGLTSDMLTRARRASRRARPRLERPAASASGNYVGLAQWEHATEAMPSWQTPRSRVAAMCWAPPFGAHAYAYSTRNREICISKPGALDKVIVQSTFDCQAAAEPR